MQLLQIGHSIQRSHYCNCFTQCFAKNHCHFLHIRKVRRGKMCYRETTWRCRCLSHRLGWCSFFKSATQAWEASTAWASSAFASALVFSAFPCLACLSKASIVLFRRASKKGPFSFYNRRNSSSSSTGLLVHVVLFSHLFFSISSFFHTDEEVIAPKSILKFRNLFCRHALKTFNFVTPTTWPLPPTKNTSLLSNYLLSY